MCLGIWSLPPHLPLDNYSLLTYSKQDERCGFQSELRSQASPSKHYLWDLCLATCLQRDSFRIWVLQLLKFRLWLAPSADGKDAVLGRTEPLLGLTRKKGSWEAGEWAPYGSFGTPHRCSLGLYCTKGIFFWKHMKLNSIFWRNFYHLFLVIFKGWFTHACT